jgi:MoxR-like ATPase
VKAQAADVLNHRIITTYEADAERLTGRDLVRTILDKVPI